MHRTRKQQPICTQNAKEHAFWHTISTMLLDE